MLVLTAVAVWASPAAAAPPAAAPSFGAFTEPAVGSLRVEWSPLSGVTPALQFYEVRWNTADDRRLTQGATSRQVPSTGRNPFTVIDGLNVGTTYYLFVRGVNSDGDGPWSSGSGTGGGRSVLLRGPLSSQGTDTAAFAGDGKADAVLNDAPADAVVVIRDYGLENAPLVVAVIGAIFLVALTFYLIRRGLMRVRGAMRL